MGIDMLLIAGRYVGFYFYYRFHIIKFNYKLMLFYAFNSQDTRVQASISVHMINTLKYILKEGSLYELSVFVVTICNPAYFLEKAIFLLDLQIEQFFLRSLKR